MTNEQIFALVNEYFYEGEIDEDGYCWIEYAGKIDAFLKFAKEMYNKGYYAGYDKGFSDKDDNKCYNAMPSE